MVAFAMTAMVACDEKDNGNDTPGNGNGNGGDNSTLAAQLVGTWQSEHIYINDVEAHMQMGIVLNADGTGELSEKKETIRQLLFEEKALPEFPFEIDHVSYLDGVKVYFKNGGWIIARFSGTEPLLRIFAEMKDQEDAQEICDLFERFLE